MSNGWDLRGTRYSMDGFKREALIFGEETRKGRNGYEGYL